MISQLLFIPSLLFILHLIKDGKNFGIEILYKFNLNNHSLSKLYKLCYMNYGVY